MLISHKTDSKLVPVAPICAALTWFLYFWGRIVIFRSTVEISKVNYKFNIELIPPYISLQLYPQVERFLRFFHFSYQVILINGCKGQEAFYCNCKRLKIQSFAQPF